MTTQSAKNARKTNARRSARGGPPVTKAKRAPRRLTKPVVRRPVVHGITALPAAAAKSVRKGVEHAARTSGTAVHRLGRRWQAMDRGRRARRVGALFGAIAALAAIPILAGRRRRWAW